MCLLNLANHPAHVRIVHLAPLDHVEQSFLHEPVPSRPRTHEVCKSRILTLGSHVGHIDRRSRISLCRWIEVLDEVAHKAKFAASRLPFEVGVDYRSCPADDRDFSDSLAFGKYEWFARPQRHLALVRPVKSMTYDGEVLRKEFRMRMRHRECLMPPMEYRDSLAVDKSGGFTTKIDSPIRTCREGG